MKVVLFCGGLGTRLREHSDTIPKPLVPIGVRPVLWHLMRYYAHFGHRDFVLCLGYRGDLIRDYFVNYREHLSNDFTLDGNDGSVQLHTRDMSDWRVTFVDTGMHANLGMRLRRVRHLLDQEPMFLANYADGISDLPLDTMIRQFTASDAVASFAAMRPAGSFHVIQSDSQGVVTRIGPLSGEALRINGGFFALRPQIFDVLQEGEELVEKPFQRLIEQRKLLAYAHDGFWQPMDTFKDKVTLDRMEASGDCPWMLWRKPVGR
jgi:glucose-1-phosphate cytidylyltransferase